MKLSKTKNILLAGFMIFLSLFDLNAQPGMNVQERKFVYMTSAGCAFGVGNIRLENRTIANRNPDYRLDQLIAYQFNDNFYMGVGAGIELWRHTAFVPVYLNLSVNMLRRKLSPMAYLNAGYGFKWYISSQPETMTRVIHGSKTGPLGEAGLGICIRFDRRISLNIAACYKFQYSAIRYTVVQPGTQDFSQYSTNSMKNVFYHFAGVRIGIMY